MTEIKDNVELTDLDELIPYTHNPKAHPDEQIDKIASSIKNYGFDQPIVVDSENEIIKGHGRLEAAKKLGLEQVPVIKQGDLSEAQAKAARLADNKTAESEWLDEELALELDELEDMDYDLELTGFGEDEINEVLGSEEIESPEAEGIDKDIKDIKILNLYAGIGGNRKFWGDLDVTAVEYNEEIAEAYQDFFPNDKVIIDDAHEYLEKHFDEYDFIWSSPPCPTHSKMRKNIRYNAGKNKDNQLTEIKAKYPDMKLYQEIIFLEGFFKRKWVVENVKSWYNPLIEPQERGPHYFWSNFNIPKIDLDIGENKHDNRPEKMEKYLDFDLSQYNFPSNYPKQKILNNCIHPELGEHILKSAYPKENDTNGTV